MDHRFPLRFGMLFLMGAAILHCSAPVAETDADRGADGDDVAGADSANVGTRSDALLNLAPRCYGKMLLPAPFDYPDQPIGLPMTVRINRACDLGALLVNRKMRVYIRSAEVGAPVGPQLMLKDWTDVPALQYRLDLPWQAGRLADGTTLPPGRYQIYSYSLNSSLYNAWLANDVYARNMSTRSDNTYVQLSDAGTWTSEDWGTCSEECGDGTQTRANLCQVNGADVDPRYCVDAPPATSQACNEGECDVVDVGAVAARGSCGTLGLLGPGFTLTAGPSKPIPAGTTLTITGSGVANIGVWSVSGGTAVVSVLSNTSRSITLTAPVPAGATIAFRTTLSITVAFQLNAAMSLPAGYTGTGAKTAGNVSSTLILCSAN